MKNIPRRKFLKNSACYAGAGLLLPSWLRRPQRSQLAIGFQTWVVREPLNEDFVGTLEKMAGYGYETLEMCSPAGYSMAGFEPLSRMNVGDMKQIIADSGLTCESSHFTADELRTNMGASIQFGHALGLTQMVVSSPGLSGDASLDDWKRICDDINEWGRLANEDGLQFAYHNHNFEFEKLDGHLIYDLLLEHLNPEVVKMQFQVWVVSIGYKAADYFRAQPSRYLSAHLSDWSGKDEEQTPIGHGTVDWSDFFEAGEKGGLKNIYVEMNSALLEDSASYLHGLRKK